MKTFTTTFIFISLFSTLIYGQTLDEKYSTKVASNDSIIFNLYDVISGEKTEERNWELFKYLFKKNAQLISTRKTSGGKEDVFFMSVDEYVKNASSFFKVNNFYERELHRVTETFGSVSHIFSSYETLNSKDNTKPVARGINSIQLFNDGKRWWIVNIYWTNETEENKIPKKYLPL